MEPLCPQCRAPLVVEGANHLLCPAHHASFELLYARAPLRMSTPLSGSPPVASGPPGGTEGARAGGPAGAAYGPCHIHPQTPGDFECAGCHVRLCATCVFQAKDGRFLCPKCIQDEAAGLSFTWAGPALAPQALPGGVMCQQHPTVAAVVRCTRCTAPLCPTCDFAYPGGTHFCPSCATSARPGLSKRRRRLVIGALALAAWATCGLVLLLSGVFAEMIESEGEDVVGAILSFLIFVPTLIGVGLGLGSLDRRLGNPLIVWVGAIWNGVLLAIWLLLVVIGLMMGGG